MSCEQYKQPSQPWSVFKGNRNVGYVLLDTWLVEKSKGLNLLWLNMNVLRTACKNPLNFCRMYEICWSSDKTLPPFCSFIQRKSACACHLWFTSMSISGCTMTGHAAAGRTSLSVEFSSSSADGKQRDDLRDFDPSEQKQNMCWKGLIILIWQYWKPKRI